MTKVDEVMFYIQQLSGEWPNSIGNTRICCGLTCSGDNTTFLRHQVTSTGGNVPLFSDMIAGEKAPMVIIDSLSPSICQTGFYLFP